MHEPYGRHAQAYDAPSMLATVMADVAIRLFENASVKFTIAFSIPALITEKMKLVKVNDPSIQEELISKKINFP